MEGLVLRLVKPFALSLVMYFSLRYLGIANEAALVASSIPFVLGIVGVMTGAAYVIAACVFVVAALSALLPPKYQNGVDFVDKVFNVASLDRGSNVAMDKEKAHVKNEPPVKATK